MTQLTPHSHAVPLSVELIAHSSFTPPADIPWETQAPETSALLEFAGRACYETWDKPNDRTAENEDYIRHLLDVGHLMVFEHATATMYLRGLSRSAAHEIMRHRTFSFSELSPRYVPEDESAVVMPDAIKGKPELEQLFLASSLEARVAYETILGALEAEAEQQGTNTVLHRRQARQAARGILPSATETRLVMTGNFRSWRHFIAMHGGEAADPEIRKITIEALNKLVELSPEAFSDFTVTTLKNGSQMAASPYVSSL